jgi:hypothetical protein
MLIAIRPFHAAQEVIPVFEMVESGAKDIRLGDGPHEWVI